MQLKINQEGKELKNHGSYEFPVLISYERLSYFDTREFPWHWHPEIELTLVMEGNIAYQVNDSLYHLKAGEGLFCNTNVLCTGKLYQSEDCSYLSITFHPRLLYGYSSSVMQNKYMKHILESPAMASIHFVPETGWHREVLELIEHIRCLEKENSPSMELQIQIALLEIWRRIYEHTSPEQTEHAENDRDTERIRQIMEYVQVHYAEKITLEDLADHIHLCKSESCRLFKRYMNESMFDYLLGYRIDRSLELLRSTSLGITDIALMTGFSNPGYYSRIFKRRLGCTPVEYRKAYSSKHTKKNS